MKITVCESGTDFAKKDAPSIREPAHVAALLKDLAKSDTEFFAVLSLNQKYRLIALDVIAMGTANACIASALTFGDIEDPDSKASRLLRENEHFRMHEELGTGPGFFYLWEKKQ